jgi:hypothetical protein
VEKDVTVEYADSGVLDAVDAAYREKYGRRFESIVDNITDADHRNHAPADAPDMTSRRHQRPLIRSTRSAFSRATRSRRRWS